MTRASADVYGPQKSWVWTQWIMRRRVLGRCEPHRCAGWGTYPDGLGSAKQGTRPRGDLHGHLVGTRRPPHVSLQVEGRRDPSKHFLRGWSVRRQPPVEG